MRKVAKTVFACAYTWSGASRWATRPDAATPLILGYHRVVENFARSAQSSIPAMLIEESMLDRQIDWLGRRYDFVSLDDIGAHLESGEPFRRPAAAITFDDGYRDVYWRAYPLLVRKGVPAAVFIVTDLVGTRRLQVYDKLYYLIESLLRRGDSASAVLAGAFRAIGMDGPDLAPSAASNGETFKLMTLLLNRFSQPTLCRLMTTLEQESPLDQNLVEELAPLDWDMVADMHSNGVTIGSHTVTHSLLTRESVGRVQVELTRSKQAIESKLKCEVKHFAYPDGRFNSAVVKAVEAAGYRFGYGICQTRDARRPLLTIPRKMLWQKACVGPLGRFSGAIMNCQTQWIFGGSRCEHDHGASAHVPRD